MSVAVNIKIRLMNLSMIHSQATLDVQKVPLRAEYVFAGFQNASLGFWSTSRQLFLGPKRDD